MFKRLREWLCKDGPVLRVTTSEAPGPDTTGTHRETGITLVTPKIYPPLGLK